MSKHKNIVLDISELDSGNYFSLFVVEMRHTVVALLVGMALVGCESSDRSSSPPIPSAGPFGPHEYDEPYVSAILEHFDCDVRSALKYVMRPENPLFMAMPHGDGPIDRGGFGAQMVLILVPAMTTAFLFGKRLAPDLSSSTWNYGCPGHATGADVLQSLRPPEDGGVKSGCTGGGGKCPTLIGGGTVELQWKSPTCRGRKVPLAAIRNATADFLFTLTPFFAQGVSSAVAALDLPSPEPFLAVHLRGGDKLVAEWSGGLSHLGKPERLVAPIVEAAAHERATHSPTLSHRLFIESDDCALMLEVEKQLGLEVSPNGLNFSVVHFPCVVPPPAVYTQRGNSMEVTGHHQGNFNANHTCADLVRYFAGLTVFRDAQATLLGPGGTQGGAVRSPARTSSNTVLFIELLRRGRAQKPEGREYHFGKAGAGVILS